MVVIKCLTRSEEDMISQFPDALICDVLCHLSTKDAVRTSALSKRWKNMWQRVPGLDLDSKQFETLSEFLSFANSFFDLQRGSMIRKLCLHISGWDHDGYNSFLNPWIDHSPATRKIEHLDIRTTTLSKITVLPKSIYTCKTLVHLRLCWVTLVKTESVSLPCLKILHLKHVIYPNKATVEKLISDSLYLEDLTLISLSSPEHEKVLHVQSQTLKRIYINVCTKVDIDAPLLQCLRANVNVSKKFKIISSGFSAKADISFCGLSDHDLIRDIFNDILKVRDLVISSNNWKVITEYLKPSLQFCYLSHLHFHLLHTCSDMLPAFLESCPKLESLILELMVGVGGMKVNTVSTVPSCLVSSLKFVEFKRPISGCEAELKLVKYFLKNSTSLKKVTLRVSNYRMIKAKDAILGELFATPKCSMDCELLVL